MGSNSAVHDVGTRGLFIVASWLALAYALIMWLGYGHEAQSAMLYGILFIGLAPFLLWALIDYKAGVLITLLVLPLHFPPQWSEVPIKNFAFYAALATALGFAVRPSTWAGLRKHWDHIYWWLLAAALSVALSLVLVIFRDSSSVAAHEVTRPGSLLYAIGKSGQLLLALGFVAVLVRRGQEADVERQIIDALLAGTVIATIFGVVGLVGVAACDGGRLAISAFAHTQRITATFHAVTSAAAFFSMTLPLIAYRYACLGRTAYGVRWLVFFVLVIVLVASTHSRTGMLAIVLSVCALFLRTSPRAPMSYLGASVVALFSAVVVFAAPNYPGCACPDADPVECSVTKFLYPNNRANIDQASSVTDTLLPRLRDNHATRLELLNGAIAVWREAPLTGVGIGMLAREAAFGSGAGGTDAHNFFLTLLAEQGVFGVLAWGGLFGYLGLRIWRCRSDLVRLDSPMRYAVLMVFTVLLFFALHQVDRALWGWVGIGLAAVITGKRIRRYSSSSLGVPSSN